MPACYPSYQCVGEFELGHKIRSIETLAPVEKPTITDQQIYHKDRTSQNALINWIPLRLCVPADFFICLSVSNRSGSMLSSGKWMSRQSCRVSYKASGYTDLDCRNK